MKILLTGAAGGIGSVLAKKFHEEQHELFLVDNLSGGNEENLAKLDFPFVVHNFDLSVSEDIDEIFSEFNPDIVVHLASVTALADCQSEPEVAFKSNTLSTLLLLEKSRGFSVKRFILASTSAVYEGTQAATQKETDSVAPYLIYPLTKKMSEDLCRSYSSVYGIPVTVLRLFNVFGPNQNAIRMTPPLLNYLCREYLSNRIPTLHSTGNQKRDYVSVYDVVEAFSSVIKSSENLPMYSIVNIASGEQISVKEIDQIVRDSLDIDILPNYREASKIWSQFTKLSDSVHPLPEEIVRREVEKESLGEITVAKSLLNWDPVSVKEGIKRVVEEIKRSQVD